ncbi:MAG: corrinoid protein [Spirochaetota bacterium]
MDTKQAYGQLSNAIVETDQEKIKVIAQQALDKGIDPLEAVQNGLSEGMKIVGKKFESGEVFLPEMLMAAEAFNKAMEVFKPAIESQKKEIDRAGKVVIGTVKGDVHNIGKNIVATVLETNGYEVVDIGVDQQSLNIIEEAQKQNADVIALSALMTTSMPGQKEVIEILKEKGLREKFLVMVGGGPVSREWAEEIGADGYGQSPFRAVSQLERLLAVKK